MTIRVYSILDFVLAKCVVKICVLYVYFLTAQSEIIAHKPNCNLKTNLRFLIVLIHFKTSRIYIFIIWLQRQVCHLCHLLLYCTHI